MVVTDTFAILACIGAAVGLALTIVMCILLWKKPWKTYIDCPDSTIYITLHSSEQWANERRHDELINTINSSSYTPPPRVPSSLDRFWGKIF